MFLLIIVPVFIKCAFATLFCWDYSCCNRNNVSYVTTTNDTNPANQHLGCRLSKAVVLSATIGSERITSSRPRRLSLLCRWACCRTCLVIARSNTRSIASLPLLVYLLILKKRPLCFRHNPIISRPSSCREFMAEEP